MILPVVPASAPVPTAPPRRAYALLGVIQVVDTGDSDSIPALTTPTSPAVVDHHAPPRSTAPGLLTDQGLGVHRSSG
ncbi:hypothetical protein [Streptosporangium longisporum]|uniref:hypothetical protein n=1 Tax=Streptosporangium longisporum TaxID=46187 RepID=UPI0031E6A2BD